MFTSPGLGKSTPNGRHAPVVDLLTLSEKSATFLPDRWGVAGLPRPIMGSHSLYDADGNPIRLLNTDQAAAYINCSPAMLREWRRRKECRGPRYFRHRSLVRYRIEDLDRWVFLGIEDPEASR